MKCVLVVHSGQERIRRSCELPHGVCTKKQLRAFVQSQDLRLNSVDFTFTVSLVRAASDSGEKAEKVALGKDSDVLHLFQKAEMKQSTHLLTFEVTIDGSASKPKDLDSLLSAEYAADKDLVTLHIYSPSASSSCEDDPKYQEKMFIIPTRFVLANLVRAVEDTLSISPTKHGMKLVLYTMPQQRGGKGVEITDDAAALQLLRHHASQRTKLRLTHATRAPTPKPPSQSHSRRASQQQFAASRVMSPPPPTPAQSPAPSLSGAGARNPKPHPPPLSNLTDGPLSPSSGKPPQSPPVQKGVTSPSLSSQEGGTPLSSAQEAAPSPSDSTETPYHVFLRQPSALSTKYEVPVQVRAPESESAAASALTSHWHEFCFVYTKKEMQLWRRFAVECEAATGVATATLLPVLSSDPSVCLGSDSVLREWLALAKESQQPLRVLLSLRRPAPPTFAKGEAPVASTPAPPIVLPDKALAGSDATAVSAVDSDSAPVSETRCRPNGASTAQSGDAESLPEPGANATLSPLPPINGESTGQTRSMQRSLSSLQRSSLSSLKGVSSSLAPLAESPTTADSAVSSTRQDLLSPKSASSSSSSAKVAHGTVLQASSPDMAEVKEPPLVMRTAAGPSIATVTAARLSCVCEANGGDSPSVRVQILVRWGTQQRMVLCRLRESTALEDLRRAILGAFCGSVTGPDGTTPLSMELIYVADGRLLCVPLDTGVRLLDLRTALLVDSAEVSITAPATPPSPQRMQEVNDEEKGGDVRQASAMVLQMLANAIDKHSSLPLPATSADIGDFLRAELGKQAAVEPFRKFLDFAVSTPLNDATSNPGADASSGRHFLPWISSVLARMEAPSAATEVAEEVTSLLLRSRLCDSDFLLDQLAVSARVVGEEGVGAGDAVPSTTLRPSLAALWTAAGFATPQGTSTSAWNPFCATHVGSTSGWKAAYAAAPAAVLDLLAAGSMDGLWTFTHHHDPQVDRVWQRSLEKAHRECCESISPRDLEHYFKAGDSPDGGSTRHHRRVILSCVGALLAPSSAAICDYAEWLSQRFRGKVATVLYTNMLDYDGSSHLTAFAVSQVSWTLLHPHLCGRTAAASSPTILERLHVWALLATQRVCQQRRMHFPPCPLLHVHTAAPVPFVGSGIPASVSGGKIEPRTPKSPSAPHGGVSVTETPSAPPGRLPDPEDNASHPDAHPPANRKVRYTIKYNFDSLRSRLKKK
ncbi:hypothetical protein JKF63_05885 [Porcisia hertigi]|uniref:Uncharacterized protein n=1 Tax=Porcisia hertigi TaxID=2761500 RepID=A0A836HV57_9TRYP|nr:hypothetical protein JKF63_05885 [Porcisia hertigi]